MSELENGYYWVSYKDMKPVIMEKEDDSWYAIGIETEADIIGYKILGKVSEWDSSVPQANELSPHVSWRSELLICPHCGKYKRMQGNGIIHQLCVCGE